MNQTGNLEQSRFGVGESQEKSMGDPFKAQVRG